eukprot:m.373607 g.373607  ORF g.373607 m.373607 type:complete len:51 (-) comp68591_c0_seq1:43-195(-)
MYVFSSLIKLLPTKKGMQTNKNKQTNTCEDLVLKAVADYVVVYIVSFTHT